jgi:hypothetical protein
MGTVSGRWLWVGGALLLPLARGTPPSSHEASLCLWAVGCCSGAGSAESS